MQNTIIAVAKYTFIEAWRTRVVWVAVAAFAAIALLAVVLSNIAITESDTLRVAVKAPLTRICCIFLVTLFAVTSIAREIQDKGLEIFLAVPHSRAAYVMGRFCGIALLAVLVVALGAGFLVADTELSNLVNWMLSLYFETLLVSAFGLVCALGFRQASTAIFATVGFYVLARSMDALQLIADNQVKSMESGFTIFSQWFVDMLSFLLPSLNRFADTTWLVYPDEDASLWFSLGQSAVYMLLLAGMLLVDFHRREI